MQTGGGFTGPSEGPILHHTLRVHALLQALLKMQQETGILVDLLNMKYVDHQRAHLNLLYLPGHTLYFLAGGRTFP